MPKATSDKGEALFTAEWFPYYFERFEGSDKVAAMSLAEEGAYHRAIRLAWKFGTVPSDPKLLAAKLGKRCTVQIAKVVLSTFVACKDEFLCCKDDSTRCKEHFGRSFHPVVEEIRAQQAKKAAVSREKGRKGADKRWHDDDSDSPHAGKDSPAIAQLYPSYSTTNIDLNLISQSEMDFKRLMDACVRANATIDRRVVELGVLYTILQRDGVDRGPIRSVRYFDPEIKKVAAQAKGMGDKAIDALLERRRQQVFAVNGEQV